MKAAPWTRNPMAIRWLLPVLALLAWPLPSLATHEADHRYTVFGQVLDADGGPLADTDVEITIIGGQPVGRGRTDAEGRYRITMHVHDEALGRRFWVTAAGKTRGASFTFEPGNKSRERQHRLDFPPPPSQ